MGLARQTESSLPRATIIVEHSCTCANEVYVLYKHYDRYFLPTLHKATTGTDHSTRATVMPQAGEKLPDTIAGRLSKSQDLKEEGNTLFKQQEWRKAIKKYHHSLMYVKGITDRGDKLLALGGLIDTQTTVLKPTKEQEKMAEEVLVALHNNIAGMDGWLVVSGIYSTRMHIP